MLGEEVSLSIVGNKTDLEKERHVSAEEAERCARLCVIDYAIQLVTHCMVCLSYLLSTLDIFMGKHQ